MSDTDGKAESDWEPHWEAREGYEEPEIRGVPQEGERATIVYKSFRTGAETSRTGEVVNVMDEMTGSELYISHCEVTLEDAAGEFKVWLGGSFHPEWVGSPDRPKGYEPSMVYTRFFQSNPNGGGHWRENQLGHVTEAIFPAGMEVTITFEGLTPDELNWDRIESDLRKRATKYRSHRKKQINVTIEEPRLLGLDE